MNEQDQIFYIASRYLPNRMARWLAYTYAWDLTTPKYLLADLKAAEEIYDKKEMRSYVQNLTLEKVAEMLFAEEAGI